MSVALYDAPCRIQSVTRNVPHLQLLLSLHCHRLYITGYRPWASRWEAERWWSSSSQRISDAAFASSEVAVPMVTGWWRPQLPSKPSMLSVHPQQLSPAQSCRQDTHLKKAGQRNYFFIFVKYSPSNRISIQTVVAAITDSNKKPTNWWGGKTPQH